MSRTESRTARLLFLIIASNGNQRRRLVFPSNGRCEGEFSLAPAEPRLEADLQSDLHYSLASRANKWIACRKVRRQERGAERNGRTRGITRIDKA